MMNSRRGRVATFGAFMVLAQTLPGLAHASNESVLRDLKAFLAVPERTEHLRVTFHGMTGPNHKKCTVNIGADPGYLIAKIQTEKLPLSASEIEVAASGMNRSGDRIDVTKVTRFPQVMLVTTYFERRTGLKEKGNLTLVVGRDAKGALMTLSISDGQGIVNCFELTPASFEEDEDEEGEDQ